MCIHCLSKQSTRANLLITGSSLAPRSEGARMFQREGVKTTSIAREVVSTVYGGELPLGTLGSKLLPFEVIRPATKNDSWSPAVSLMNAIQ